MKASELRIGNLVYVTYNLTNLIYKEVTPINIHNLMHLTGYDKSPVDIEFEPIPLTKEWLEKFGFKYTSSNNSYLTYTKSNYYLQTDVRKANNKWKIFDDIISDLVEFAKVDITHVHQLQNIYFALTGKELTIKKL